MTDRFPPGACDTHMHVYDQRYPSAPTAALRPPDASIDTYRTLQDELGLQRIVVVQPTTYGLDNRCQLDAAARFGADARAVAVVDASTTGSELDRLHGLGVRGARFHMLPGGAVGWTDLPLVADRIAPLGWHIQLQLDGNRLREHLDGLLALPTPIVVDHVGRFMPPPEPDDERFGVLLRMLATGRCWVKLSAPYESTHDGAPAYPSVTRLVEVLVERHPDRLLWASNWPHPGQAVPLTPGQLRALAWKWFPTAELRRRVLVDNPVELYGFHTDRPHSAVSPESSSTSTASTTSVSHPPPTSEGPES